MRALFKGLFSFFVSLRTTLWLTAALLCMLLYGAVIMPAREEFQTLHTTPLFEWLETAPAAATWWLFAAIAVLSLLTANTIICSVESLWRKRSSRQFLLLISPQVVHIGFLLILLAHLLSAYDSFRGITFVDQGSLIPLPNGLTVSFDAIHIETDPAGFIANWAADVRYFRDGAQVFTDRIEPNSPSLFEGLGIYIKTVRPVPVPSAMIEVCRDAGSVWALAGGLLFLSGMTTLLILRVRREEADEAG